MTSDERREARYRRRKAKREAKALVVAGRTFEEVMSFGNLVKAGKACCEGTRWKTSTINFENNLLSESLESYEVLRDGKRKFRGFHSFCTIEHGKARDIDALPIKERAIQKCLCANLLTESYSRSFIYDNSASLKDKGMDFGYFVITQVLIGGKSHGKHQNYASQRRDCPHGRRGRVRRQGAGEAPVRREPGRRFDSQSPPARGGR